VALCDLSDGSARVLRQPIAPADGPPPVPRESAAPATALASPDGRHLAFVWHVGQGQGSTTSLRVMDRSGANERILQTLTAGSIAIRKWMPDGRRLFVEDRPAGGPARDVLVSIDTAPVVLRERLPEDLTADLSPDGRTIIVARRVGAQADLVAIDAATGAERWRVSDPAEDVFPKFTPDGRSVAFVSDRLGGHSVFVVPVTSLGPAGPPDLLREFGRSRVELIGFGAGGSLFMTVQPGARTAFVADLGLDDLAVGTPHPLDPRAIDDTMAADWNLDGTRIAYIRGRAIRSDSRPEVVIRDVNGGTTWEFPLRGTLMNHGNHVEWSPDSRSLAVLHLEPPTTRTSGSAPAPATPVLYVIDIATRTPRRIRSGPMFDPQWEPSGHALYVGTPDAILRVDLRSAAESPVYEPGPAGRLRGLDLASHAAAFAVLMTPTVKPGAQIQACRLLIVRDGRAGPPLPLTGADCTSVAWADRSRVLVSIIARAGPQLLLVDTSTGQTTRLPLAAAGLRELRVRRDARQLLFTAGDPRPDVWEMTGLPPGR
jgi:dipeptidyl aminopeptidase/acylaminoacyl peptidase